MPPARHIPPRRPGRAPVPARAAWALFVSVVIVAAAGAGAAAAPAFVARVDRDAVPVDDSFIYEVTLSLEGGTATGYRAPPFKGFRVISEQPSQSHQFRFGSGGAFNQTVYTWRYELQPTGMGDFTIEPARVMVGGQRLETQPVRVRITQALGTGQARPRPAPQGRFPFGGLLGVPAPPPPPPPDPGAITGSDNFLRAEPSKTRVFAGEQLTVTWSLWLSQRQDRYQPLREPRMDGFWVEELPVPGQSRGLQLEQREHQGRTYLAATLLRRALFPLRPGKLTVTPLEAEIARVDFFGTQVRSEKLATEALDIEVEPLPAAGRPADLDEAAVGRFSLSAQVDRARAEVGDAVTFTLVVQGDGNLHKLSPPALPALPGWKRYEPKVSVALEPGERVQGRKTVEILLLAERAGVTTLPALELAYFDPGERAYRRARSEPLRIEVTGDASATAAPPGAEEPPMASAGGPLAKGENLLPTELRPIRSGPRLRRDLGASVARSPAFPYVLAGPPALFGLALLAGGLRQRLGQHTEHGRKRALRRAARRRLRAAEAHLDAGATGPFFVEIDRVLRELLSARLRAPVSGLNRDELRQAILGGGLDASTADGLLDLFDRCDRARFAPGNLEAAELRATLDTASDLASTIERGAARAADRRAPSQEDAA